MNVSFAGFTDQGLIRPENQDAIYLPIQMEPIGSTLFLAVDGLGPGLAGQQAGRIIAEMVPRLFRQRQVGLGAEAALRLAIRETAGILHETALKNSELSDMAAAVTALTVEQERALVAHLGNCRAYLCRKNQLHHLTTDHSVLMDLARQGRIRPEQIPSHPLRHTLTKALSTDPQVEPEFFSFRLEPKDVVLLCTDGLYDLLNDNALSKVLSASSSATQKITDLFKLAKARNAPDNLTMIVLTCSESKQAHSAHQAASPALIRPQAPAAALDELKIERMPPEEPDEHSQPLTPEPLVGLPILIDEPLTLESAADKKGQSQANPLDLAIDGSPVMEPPADPILPKQQPFAGNRIMMPHMAERVLSARRFNFLSRKAVLLLLVLLGLSLLAFALLSGGTGLSQPETETNASSPASGAFLSEPMPLPTESFNPTESSPVIPEASPRHPPNALQQPLPENTPDAEQTAKPAAAAAKPQAPSAGAKPAPPASASSAPKTAPPKASQPAPKPAPQASARAEAKPAPMPSRFYTVCLASLKSPTAAQSEVRRLAGKGLSAKVIKVEVPGRGTQYRVCVGNYETSVQAEQQAKQWVQKNTIKDFFVFRLPQT